MKRKEVLKTWPSQCFRQCPWGVWTETFKRIGWALTWLSRGESFWFHALCYPHLSLPVEMPYPRKPKGQRSTYGWATGMVWNIQAPECADRFRELIISEEGIFEAVTATLEPVRPQRKLGALPVWRLRVQARLKGSGSVKVVVESVFSERTVLTTRVHLGDLKFDEVGDLDPNWVWCEGFGYSDDKEVQTTRWEVAIPNSCQTIDQLIHRVAGYLDSEMLPALRGFKSSQAFQTRASLVRFYLGFLWDDAWYMSFTQAK